MLVLKYSIYGENVTFPACLMSWTYQISNGTVLIGNFLLAVMPRTYHISEDTEKCDISCLPQNVVDIPNFQWYCIDRRNMKFLVAVMPRIYHISEDTGLAGEM